MRTTETWHSMDATITWIYEEVEDRRVLQGYQVETGAVPVRIEVREAARPTRVLLEPILAYTRCERRLPADLMPEQRNVTGRWGGLLRAVHRRSRGP